ncbi:MAG: LytTR family transcriptional regulator [Myxococcales bacterium]|nr:LytTR family transcriptional regulator [Myxococcales bacterium]
MRLERLAQALDRVRQHARSDAPKLDRLAVRRKGALVVVDVGQVLYFEVKDELVWAITRDDRYALDMSLTEIESRVGPEFFRSHRSVLVRVSAIAAIEPTGAGASDIVIDHPEAPRVSLARERTKALKEIIPVLG